MVEAVKLNSNNKSNFDWLCTRAQLCFESTDPTKPSSFYVFDVAMHGQWIMDYQEEGANTVQEAIDQVLENAPIEVKQQLFYKIKEGLMKS